jgi:hypothetical protein
MSAGGLKDTADLIMSVERDPATGRWRVIADDGSILEGDFSTAAAAWRWVDDRAEGLEVRQGRVLGADPSLWGMTR